MAGHAFQRPVDGAGIGAPQPGVGQVGDARGELVAADGEQAEHDVGVAAGVGDHRLRFGASIQVEDGVQDEQRVAQGARYDQAADAHHLIVDHVQPGSAALAAEVDRVVTGVQIGDRDNEAQPIGRGDVPTAPGFHHTDAGLGGDQLGVGGRDRLGAQIALVDLLQPGPGQRRHVRLLDRHQVDVARLGHQQPAQADREVVHPGIAAGDVGEVSSQPGAVEHLQQQLGKVDARQHVVDQGAQLLHQRRLGDRAQLLQLQAAADELHRGARAQPVQHPGIDTLQCAGELGQMGGRFGLQLQRGENPRHRRPRHRRPRLRRPAAGPAGRSTALILRRTHRADAALGAGASVRTV